jgi:hypothetical protein
MCPTCAARCGSSPVDTQVELESATAVLMDLDDEVFDTAAMHPGNGNDKHVRVPRAGTYVLSGEVEWAPNDNGYRTLDLLRLDTGIEALGSSLVEPRHSVNLELVRGTLSAAFVGP